MSLRQPQQIAVTGTSPAFTAADAALSETFVWDEDLVLEVKNTDAAARTATLVIPGSTFGQANPDVAVNVPANTGHVRIGPIPREAMDPVTGLVTVTLSASANVTVALTRV